MPTKPPHHVSTQEFQNPHSHRSVRPNMRNEPNLLYRHPATTQEYETNPICSATKCPPTPHFSETNPIYRLATRATTQKHETNPIYNPANSQSPTAKSCFYGTNPIYPYPSLPYDPKMRNKPNLGTHSVPPPSPAPKNAKQTQSPATNIHSTIYNIQSNGPISAPPLASCLYYAKQTQFCPDNKILFLQLSCI